MHDVLAYGLAVLSSLLMACGSPSGGDQTAKDAEVPRDAAGHTSPPPDGGTLHDAAPPNDAAVISDIGQVSTSYPAPHAPMPQVVSSGGPILASPVFIPITFPDDPYQEDIATFTSQIGTLSYWSAVVSEYGVGNATSGTPVILTASQEPAETGATVSDSDLQTWLGSQISSGALVGTYTASTVYAIFLPSGTISTLAGSGTGCTDYGGYHNSANVGPSNASVSYVVVPRCPSLRITGGTLTGLDVITGVASHEYAEASTDPQPDNDPAYLLANDFIWEYYVGGGEIMDMCEANDGVFYKPSGFNYTVQRGWSNQAASTGHDPCQPELPGEVYLNSAPALPTLSVDGGADGGGTNALSLLVGHSQTIDINLYSEAATTGPWMVEANDIQALAGNPAALGFSWVVDENEGQNGQVLHLTIEAKSFPKGALDGVVLLSTLGGQQSFWVADVVVE